MYLRIARESHADSTTERVFRCRGRRTTGAWDASASHRASGIRGPTSDLTSDIAAATGRPSIPAVGHAWPGVHVYAPLRQRVRVKDSRKFDRVERIRDARLYPEQLRERAGQLVLFGAYQGEIPNLIRDGLLTGGAVVWSMWEGYLDEPSGQRLQAALQAASIPLIQHHTSGHARLPVSRGDGLYPADLVRLVQALRPDVVVPIHTEAPDAYASTIGELVQPHADGTGWTV